MRGNREFTKGEQYEKNVLSTIQIAVTTLHFLLNVNAREPVRYSRAACIDGIFREEEEAFGLETPCTGVHGPWTLKVRLSISIVGNPSGV